MEGVTLTMAEYRRLLLASEADDSIIACEVCSAWIAKDEPAYCTAEDYACCWKAATGKENALCVSHRAIE